MDSLEPWQNIPEDYSGFVGFVYEIIELDTGMRYIGQKKFFKIKKKAALKTPNAKELVKLKEIEMLIELAPNKKAKEPFKQKKRELKAQINLRLESRTGRKRKTIIEDWRDYLSSSPILKEKIPNNPSNYKRIILSCHTSKMEMNIHETYRQMQYYIEGNWDKLYNEVINLRGTISKKASDPKISEEPDYDSED